MYPRTNYEMTEEDLKTLLDSCKPTPVMMMGGYSASSPQENANRAWESLGERMGFDHMTVRPIPGKEQRFFSAVPKENETQRDERLSKEKEDKRLFEIKKIKEEIETLKNKLCDLNTCKGVELGDGNYSGCTGIGGDCPECGK